MPFRTILILRCWGWYVREFIETRIVVPEPFQATPLDYKDPHAL